jgi:hypothetical protein
MIRKKYIVMLLLVLSCGSVMAQQTLESLRLKYEQFEYSRVIQQARDMLLHREQMDTVMVKEVLYLSAVANYSLQNLDGAMVDFLELLRLDPLYQLKPSDTSPKIIQFFEEIRSSSSRTAAKERIIIKHDTVRVAIEQKPWQPAMKRSLLWPGWGQSYLGDNGKGTVLRMTSVLAFSVSLYGVIECRDKERQYHDNIDKSAMDEKYKSYNSAYKMRNAALCSFAALWLYSQVDMLFLHRSKPAALSCHWDEQPCQKITISCSVPLR